MARQASLEASGGSSSATAASNSWTAITLDAVRTREGPRPRDPTEQARLPAGVGGVAQLVLPVLDVLANAHLDVDWYESTQIWRCIILALRGPSGVRVLHENRSDMARYSKYSIAMSRYERRILENSGRQYSLPYFRVLRARIVLSAADGDSPDQNAAALSAGRDVVSLWRKRFFYERLAGLDERPRSGSPLAFPPVVVV